MLQRLTKKQISKLGKKASYKSKQNGGKLDVFSHRPGWLKGVFKKDKNTIVNNDEYKKFRHEVTGMFRDRAKKDSKYKSASGHPIFTPLDLKIILIYLLHKKKFSNAVEGLNSVQKVDKIIENPIITNATDEPEIAKKARELYTKIFTIIFSMDINNMEFVFNTEVNKNSYINWLRTHYGFFYINKDKVDEELLIEFLKYKLDGEKFIKKKDEDFCDTNKAIDDLLILELGGTIGVLPKITKSTQCKNYLNPKKKKNRAYITK